MAQRWPWPLPLAGWAGLANPNGEITYPEYARQPVTMELTADGVTAANLGTLEWPTATHLNGWGALVNVPVHDAPTGGNLLFTALLGVLDTYGAVPFGNEVYGVLEAPFAIEQYQRLRIQAGAIGMTAQTGPRGYGTGGFGTYAYVIAPAAAAIVTPEITFGVVYPCEGGTWAPGPIARAA